MDVGRGTDTFPRIQGIVSGDDVEIFSDNRAFWLAVGLDQLGKNIASIVPALGGGEAIDFGEPLFGGLIVPVGESNTRIR